VTCSLDCHLVKPDGLIVWMRPPGGLRRSKLHSATLAVICVFAHWRMTRTHGTEGLFGGNLRRVNLATRVPLLRSLRVRNALPWSLVGRSLLLADRAARGLLKQRNSWLAMMLGHHWPRVTLRLHSVDAIIHLQPIWIALTGK
jgi:hypothetical protein